MDEMSIAPDTLRADAAWVRTFADHISESPWPAVELEGAEVAAVVGQVDPGLDALVRGLRAWADAATASAAELEAADHRAAGGLVPR